MAFDEIEIVPGKFLYRCDGCGYEHPIKPVDKHHLGRPPDHNCPHGEWPHPQHHSRPHSAPKAIPGDEEK